jgi:hypothetical protein
MLVARAKYSFSDKYLGPDLRGLGQNIYLNTYSVKALAIILENSAIITEISTIEAKIDDSATSH